MHKIEKRDYLRIAKNRQVKWLGESIPETTYTSTEWQCLICERHLKKSYQRMKNYENSCRCRSGTIRTPQDYRNLAKDLSKRFSAQFEFPEQMYPQNTYQKVIWSINGYEISETYHNLAYYEKLPEYVKRLTE